MKLTRDVEDTVLSETATLGRNLSSISAYMIVISRIIGSGIFATTWCYSQGHGKRGAGSDTLDCRVFIAGCSVLISLEYGCSSSRSGGEKVYIEFTYRYPRFLASTLVAVIVVLLGFTASNCLW